MLQPLGTALEGCMQYSLELSEVRTTFTAMQLCCRPKPACHTSKYGNNKLRYKSNNTARKPIISLTGSKCDAVVPTVIHGQKHGLTTYGGVHAPAIHDHMIQAGNLRGAATGVVTHGLYCITYPLSLSSLYAALQWVCQQTCLHH